MIRMILIHILKRCRSGEQGAGSKERRAGRKSGEPGAGSTGDKENRMNEGFRFQRMEIWKRAAKLSRNLFDIANELEKQRLYRFAEQLRAATLSITNNIAEGSGSHSNADFANFLNISRRSVFENANIILILQENDYLVLEDDSILKELEELSRMIFSFRKTLKK